MNSSDTKAVNHITHIGIAVKNIEESLPFYMMCLGLKLTQMETIDSQSIRVAFLKVGEAYLELIEPITTTSTVAEFINKRGEGLHHIALAVDDIQQRVDLLKQKGIQAIDEEIQIGADGQQIAFLHPSVANGVLFELCQEK
ncbi:MAG: methylmalonyl-CoA epimerase [Bacillota bacterium]|uniref:Methylmalonyl-CoA epimerase n=1 Tax=Virgibacillus salarius TaxID=447199 RepID=A0A941DT66_9BACI|nr:MULTISPECIES: methylmalonyl-CoA epimerase [Bacillaceae]NAZ09429.1 methylmalonyl-CoA epimerase [Agaribacter marinus]MBR7796719.1 methylmalonyl-CoA epimerase [Virgibacillus salarius]MCC2249158.1 methylmalonyl-CoA epimerase [Virgibacillus sp. AGTR]MDY7043460.1 methylmalonyl-CoA epimerase [Virgibacillus sp. M23]QRZ16936.1 methylmalonyl-CoA epimerase [Virgibacillus sp. AGTR]